MVKLFYEGARVFVLNLITRTMSTRTVFKRI